MKERIGIGKEGIVINKIPDCNQEINQKNYLNNYFWRKAVIEHMRIKHNKTVEDEHY